MLRSPDKDRAKAQQVELDRFLILLSPEHLEKDIDNVYRIAYLACRTTQPKRRRKMEKQMTTKEITKEINENRSLITDLLDLIDATLERSKEERLKMRVQRLRWRNRSLLKERNKRREARWCRS